MVGNFRPRKEKFLFIEMTEEEYKLNEAAGIIEKGCVVVEDKPVKVIMSNRSVHPTYPMKPENPENE
jgi:hypothetical protein